MHTNSAHAAMPDTKQIKPALNATSGAVSVCVADTSLMGTHIERNIRGAPHEFIPGAANVHCIYGAGPDQIYV